MHYLLNIGNTRTAVACGIPGKQDFRVEFFNTPEIAEQWRPGEGEWHATASAVVPAVREALQKRFPGRIHFISPEDFPQIDCSAYDVKRLGGDRLANIAAAHALSPERAVMVLDCGTALNTVCVTADGRFLGGVILPGRETALKALAKATALLPEYAVTAPHDFNPLGRTSEDGIRNGVDLGVLGAAERIIRATRQIPEMADCRVWFAGGDAPFFVKYLPPELHAELPPVPLTLYGIYLANREAL